MGKKKKEWNLDSPVAAKIRTICEVHRDIYDEIESIEDEEKKKILINLLQEAYGMGKKLALKLFEYKGGNRKAFIKEMEYEHNLDYLLKRKNRKRRNKK